MEVKLTFVSLIAVINGMVLSLILVMNSPRFILDFFIDMPMGFMLLFVLYLMAYTFVLALVLGILGYFFGGDELGK